MSNHILVTEYTYNSLVWDRSEDQRLRVEVYIKDRAVFYPVISKRNLGMILLRLRTEKMDVGLYQLRFTRSVRRFLRDIAVR